MAARLPRAFWEYAVFTGLTMAGFATFGVLSFHLVTAGLLAAAAVPLVYAAAQLVDALAALLTGWGYDRFGPKVLISLPIVAATVPALAFTGNVSVAVLGSLAWGVVLGIQESTMRATVADLVGPGRRATAYGIFGAVVGVAAFLGGAVSGALYEVSIPALITVTVAGAGGCAGRPAAHAAADAGGVAAISTCSSGPQGLFQPLNQEICTSVWPLGLDDCRVGRSARRVAPQVRLRRVRGVNFSRLGLGRL